MAPKRKGNIGGWMTSEKLEELREAKRAKKESYFAGASIRAGKEPAVAAVATTTQPPPPSLQSHLPTSISAAATPFEISLDFEPRADNTIPTATNPFAVGPALLAHTNGVAAAAAATAAIKQRKNARFTKSAWKRQMWQKAGEALADMLSEIGIPDAEISGAVALRWFKLGKVEREGLVGREMLVASANLQGDEVEEDKNDDEDEDEGWDGDDEGEGGEEEEVDETPGMAGVVKGVRGMGVDEDGDVDWWVVVVGMGTGIGELRKLSTSGQRP